VSLRARCLAAALTGLAFAGSAAPVAAASPAAEKAPAIAPLLLLPTAIADAAGPRPPRADDADLGRLAQSLDVLLGETAQDLGILMSPPAATSSPAPFPPPLSFADGALLARARAAHALVVLPSLRAMPAGNVELRLVLAPPQGDAQVRSERVARADLSVRAVVLLRDLVSRRTLPAPAALPPTGAGKAKPSAAPGGLGGRIALMANATVFGGLVGASIQLGSGSNDPRLLYPLLLAGAGIGLGASYLASGEWEVGTGDAWYWAAGVWWPTAAGHLIFQGRFAATRADSDRWVFGVIGGGVGATLATLGLALHPVSEGGAIIANGGGALGLLTGALVELGARGGAHQVPFSGMGYGAGLGWLAAAAVATQVRPRWPTRSPARRVARAFGAGMPLFGVLGESRAGPASAPIVGFGYAGSIEGLMGPFPR
jgi:hypothetical protein